jgi:Ca-activated chloride channel family protein
MAALLGWWFVRPQDTVVVVHWANVYMMEPPLLPTFQKQFNAAGHRTSTGKRIQVQTFLINSGVIVEDLVSRMRTGHPSASCYPGSKGGCPRQELGREAPDPTIVTPAAEHWLARVNDGVQRPVIDMENLQPLVWSYTGVIMLRDMARCLGWPEKEIGIADIVALRQDPRGWAGCAGARAEWGKVPLISFTDPSTSSTARSMLYLLYAMGAGKNPERLTPADVGRPEVLEHVTQFQRAVDHYVPDTVVLASKIWHGPRYGHFFFNLENQLVTLYQGKVPVTVGRETKPRPLEWDMVMVYPREGSATHCHSAGIVQAGWVDPEQAEAARRWIANLLEEAQQREFMEQGFRPATGIPIRCPICPRFGVDPKGPRVVVDPSRVDPETAERIVGSWRDVKKQGVLMLVVDHSGVMAGGRIGRARQGVARVLDAIDQRSLVGVLTYSAGVQAVIEPSPLAEKKFDIVNVVGSRVGEGSALYEAVRRAILLADAAPGDSETIRGVVVLAAGPATTGLPLHDLVRLVSKEGKPITHCLGFEAEAECLDDAGKSVPKRDIHATDWSFETRHRVHVFYVGIGAGADLEVGRILAEGTPGSSFEGVADADLAAVIERFSIYF